MQIKRQFCVRVVGLTDREFTVLKSVELLSTTRVRAYTFTDSHDTETVPDIYLVDADSRDAVETWERFRASDPAPTAFISVGGKPLFGQRGFKRPLIVTRLVYVLDEITTQELHFIPEMTIGDGHAPEPTQLQTRSSTMGSFLALVVDDSPTIRKQIELGLRKFGCDAECVETAEEALASLATRNYDLVFLDVVLPGADGYQVCKSIKRDKTTRHTPVIMLTGKTSPFDQIKGKLAGCDSYLTKPVEISLFQSVVGKYLAAISRQPVFQEMVEADR